MWRSDSKQNKDECTKPDLKEFGLKIGTCAVMCNNINVEVFVSLMHQRIIRELDRKEHCFEMGHSYTSKQNLQIHFLFVQIRFIFIKIV